MIPVDGRGSGWPTVDCHRRTALIRLTDKIPTAGSVRVAVRPILQHCCPCLQQCPIHDTDTSCPRFYPVHPHTDTSAEVFPLHHTCTHTLRTELRQGTLEHSHEWNHRIPLKGNSKVKGFYPTSWTIYFGLRALFVIFHIAALHCTYCVYCWLTLAVAECNKSLSILFNSVALGELLKGDH